MPRNRYAEMTEEPDVNSKNVVVNGEIANETNSETSNDDQPPDEIRPDEEVKPVNSLNDLDDQEMNNERDEAVRSKLFPPSGDWTKEDIWSEEDHFRMVHLDQDKQPGDVSTKGRRIYVIYGKMKPRVDRDGNEFEYLANIRISPDLRYKEDDTSKVDILHKLWLRAKDIYIAIKEEKPKSHKELIIFLLDEKYLVNTLRGDGEPFVWDLKIIRKGRGNR